MGKKASIVLLLACLALLACQQPLHRETRLSMSTALTVLVSGGERPDWEALYGYVDAEAALFDWRHPEGPVGRLNSGERLEPPREVSSALATALKVAEASGGAFDPTILPLMRLWDFDAGGRLPPEADIRQARALVNWRRLETGTDGRVGLPPGFGLDLGGIAKGAVVDLAGEYLEERGARNYLIEAGGDILISGLKEGRRPWIIAIRHPRKSQGYVGLIPMGERGKKIAIVTSGDYERYFEQGGRRYHHILDPATGYPAESLVSVTVIAPACTEADALSTAAFVLGPERALELLERWEGAEGLLIAEREGKLTALTTPGFPLKREQVKLE